MKTLIPKPSFGSIGVLANVGRTSYDEETDASLTLIINFVPTKRPVCKKLHQTLNPKPLSLIEGSWALWVGGAEAKLTRS